MMTNFQQRTEVLRCYLYHSATRKQLSFLMPNSHVCLAGVMGVMEVNPVSSHVRLTKYELHVIINTLYCICEIYSMQI